MLVILIIVGSRLIGQSISICIRISTFSSFNNVTISIIKHRSIYRLF